MLSNFYSFRKYVMTNYILSNKWQLIFSTLYTFISFIWGQFSNLLLPVFDKIIFENVRKYVMTNYILSNNWQLIFSTLYTFISCIWEKISNLLLPVFGKIIFENVQMLNEWKCKEKSVSHQIYNVSYLKTMDTYI